MIGRYFSASFPMVLCRFAMVLRYFSDKYMLNSLAYSGFFFYLCSIIYNATYTAPAPLIIDRQQSTKNVVECCGELLPADAVVLQRVMTQHRLPLKEQKSLWRSFYLQWPDPEWARICLEQAREIDSLLALDNTLFPDTAHSVITEQPSATPLSDTAERHYVWLGDRYSIGVEPLRDGISRLAMAGLIASDRDQQQAFRRCLGLTVNEQERNTNQPWVRWIGPHDMLSYLIDNLWKLGLIYCSGGKREKWKTLCGAVLRSDGIPFVEKKIRNNHCSNPEKIKVLDRAILDAMRFYIGKTNIHHTN